MQRKLFQGYGNLSLARHASMAIMSIRCLLCVCVVEHDCVKVIVA